MACNINNLGEPILVLSRFFISTQEVFSKRLPKRKSTPTARMRSVPAVRKRQRVKLPRPATTMPTASTHSYNDIFFLLPHENADAYSLLRATLLHEHRPENETERLLVDPWPSTTGCAVAPKLSRAVASKKTARSTTSAWLCSCATAPATNGPSVSARRAAKAKSRQAQNRNWVRMWDLQNWRNGFGEGAFRCGLWGSGGSFAMSKGSVGENRHAATEE
jgi:hypothetical protein